MIAKKVRDFTGIGKFEFGLSFERKKRKLKLDMPYFRGFKNWFKFSKNAPKLKRSMRAGFSDLHNGHSG